MEATFTKAGGCERLEILFGDIDGANFNPKAEADYLNHLLLNHIPASTYEALRKAMIEEPKEEKAPEAPAPKIEKKRGRLHWGCGNSILSEIEKAKLKFHCEFGMPPTFVCLGDSEAIALCHETQIHISQLSGGFLCGIRVLIDRNTDSFLGVGICTSRS